MESSLCSLEDLDSEFLDGRKAHLLNSRLWVSAKNRHREFIKSTNAAYSQQACMCTRIRLDMDGATDAGGGQVINMQQGQANKA